MTLNDLTFLPLKVINVGGRGKRTFDPDGKRRLIEACQQPGVSISGMALRAGINANQLRKWIGQCKPEPSSAFVPVATGNAIDSAPLPMSICPEMATPSLTATNPPCLTAQLPNGVTIKLECGGPDVRLVKAMIQALGVN